MRSLRAILLSVLLMSALLTFSGAPGWESVRPQAYAEQPADPDRIDVSVSGGYIYVTTSQTVTVKVMSIVGQLISQQTLQPDTSRLKVGARGIYILKIGHITRRVTV